MPFIELKTNQSISSPEEIKAELGRAITAIPGKSEAWLMVELEGDKDMYFKGSSEPCAMFEVAIFGRAGAEAYDDLTKRLCDISNRLLSVSPDRTYVKYSEIDKWGFNNFNF